MDSVAIELLHVFGRCITMLARGRGRHAELEGYLPAALPRQQQENEKENCRRAARDATKPCQTGNDRYYASRTGDEEERT